ncbi:MAG: hypothetical protein ACRBCS_16020 [Cellvibrionaceae bacterium]
MKKAQNLISFCRGKGLDQYTFYGSLLINKQKVTFALVWDSSGGESWDFIVITDKEGGRESCDGLRGTSLTSSDIKSTLEYIGVDSKGVNLSAIAQEINEQGRLMCPSTTPSEDYFGC